MFKGSSQWLMRLVSQEVEGFRYNDTSAEKEQHIKHAQEVDESWGGSIGAVGEREEFFSHHEEGRL